MKVFVYYNLHKHLWSVKALEGPNKGRVVARDEMVTLKDVRAKVSEAGRQRVLKEQRKNVHAGLVGTWVANHPMDSDRIHRALVGTGRAISYNPYKGPFFYHKDDESEFTGSAIARLYSDRSVWVAE